MAGFFDAQMFARQAGDDVVSTTGNGPGEGGEPLERNDFGTRTTSERFAEKAHRTIDEAAATASEAEREWRRAAGEAVDRVRVREEELARTVDENLGKLKTYVEKNPIQSAGLAFVAGVVLSSLLRR